MIRRTRVLVVGIALIVLLSMIAVPVAATHTVGHDDISPGIEPGDLFIEIEHQHGVVTIDIEPGDLFISVGNDQGGVKFILQN